MHRTLFSAAMFASRFNHHITYKAAWSHHSIQNRTIFPPDNDEMKEVQSLAEI